MIATARTPPLTSIPLTASVLDLDESPLTQGTPSATTAWKEHGTVYNSLKL